MTVLAERVARRFLAFQLVSDERFRPPKEIVNAVDTGEIPPEALNVWKAVVEASSGSAIPLNYGAAYAYWRNKCLKNGIALPASLLKGGQGAEHGPWKIKTGDQIEEWVKATLKAKGLLDDVAKTAHDWEMEIVHLERMIQETQTKIEGRLRGSGPGARTPLEKSKADLEKYAKQMDDAKAELTRLVSETQRLSQVKNCSIELVKDLCFSAIVDRKNLDKVNLLAAFKKAMEILDKELSLSESMELAEKSAGILDTLGKALSKAWNWLVSVFESFFAWVGELRGDTDKLASIFDQAGA